MRGSDEARPAQRSLHEYREAQAEWQGSSLALPHGTVAAKSI